MDKTDELIGTREKGESVGDKDIAKREESGHRKNY